MGILLGMKSKVVMHGAQIAESLTEALAHEKAYDYQASLEALKQVAPALLDTVLNSHPDTPRSLLDRVSQKQNQFEELINNTYFSFVLFIGILLLCFYRDENENIPTINNHIYFVTIGIQVLIFSPPINPGWSPSEWMKVSRGYFGIFEGKNQFSAFITPNSVRTGLYDFIFGGSTYLFGVDIGYYILKISSLLIIYFGLINIFEALDLPRIYHFLVLSLFALQQDLIAGNEILGIAEEDRFAIGFAIIGLSFWLLDKKKKMVIRVKDD